MLRYGGRLNYDITCFEICIKFIKVSGKPDMYVEMLIRFSTKPSSTILKAKFVSNKMLLS